MEPQGNPGGSTDVPQTDAPVSVPESQNAPAPEQTSTSEAPVAQPEQASSNEVVQAPDAPQENLAPAVGQAPMPAVKKSSSKVILLVVLAAVLLAAVAFFALSA